MTLSMAEIENLMAYQLGAALAMAALAGAHHSCQTAWRAE